MNKPKSILIPIIFLVSVGAQAQQQSVSYRLNLFHEASTPEEAKLAAELDEAVIGDRIRPQKLIGMYPDELAPTPASPSYKSVGVGPISQQVLRCDGAYAQFNAAKDTGSNPLGGSGERYTGCVFVSKAGIRSAIVIERYTRADGSIFGGIIGGISNAMQGDDAEWGEKAVNKILEAYKQRVPNALVELIETPKRLEKPDGEKVGTLLKAAAALAQPLPGVQVAKQNQSSASSTSNLSEIIEARKNINSIGMVYHSVDQLQESILRKDQVAVELFVKAAGIRADARGASGQTSAEVAKVVGDQVLIDLIRNLK